MPREISSRSVPPRALAMSAGALAVPVVAALMGGSALGEFRALLWLLALVPAFLLAYHRGWRGVATGLAVGMATLSLTQATVSATGGQVPEILLGVVVAYISISLGIGWMAEALYHERAAVTDMAFTDILTRLPNRRHARLFLENEFAAAERGRNLSVVLFDLDHFKAFNERHGAEAGDEALGAFARILERATRRMDLSARFGGEEFLSVLTSTNTEGAVIFAHRIRAALAEAELASGGTLTVSAGVAAYHPSIRSPDELLAAADHALYQSKTEGRDRVRLYGHAMLDSALPSEDAAQGLLDRLEEEPSEYPRPSEEIGRTRPPLTLLPHQITGFGAERRVLVVEDDTQVRALVSNYLSREGFYVTEAADVASGIDRLGTEFDVVVTDLRLPGAPGTELVGAVKSRWPHTQVVVITGIQDAKVAAEALNAGADQYLFKPFGMPDLRRQLTGALKRRDELRAERTVRHAGPHDARARQAEARKVVLQAFDTLADAVEVYEPWLRGHADRVGRLATILADAVDPTGTEVDREALRRGCRLHDVGRLGLPSALLGGTRSLDPGQLDVVRTYPVLGRRLVEGILDDDDMLAVLAWHHERWDGRGYPDGLSGEAIPLIARIVAVADALDAMTSPRPFRDARSWEEALEEIRREAGAQFDPKLVSAVEGCTDALRAVRQGAAPEGAARDAERSS